jgi:hypothetical protein
MEASYLRRDVLCISSSIAYPNISANLTKADATPVATDEPHFLYELHSRSATCPTYSIILPFKQTGQDVFDFIVAPGTGADIDVFGQC